jgi:hypothetical protein
VIEMPRIMPEWRWVVRFLRAGPLAGIRVSMRRARVPADRSADCSRSRSGYTIRVSREASADAAVLLLLHEAAHVLAWSLEGTEHDGVDQHDGYFGLAVARIWREFAATLDAEE